MKMLIGSATAKETTTARANTCQYKSDVTGEEFAHGIPKKILRVIISKSTNDITSEINA